MIWLDGSKPSPRNSVSSIPHVMDNTQHSCSVMNCHTSLDNRHVSTCKNGSTSFQVIFRWLRYLVITGLKITVGFAQKLSWKWKIIVIPGFMHNIRDNDIICLPCAVQYVQFLVVIVPYVFMESMLMASVQLWRSVCCLTGIRSTCQLRWWCSSWERHVEKNHRGTAYINSSSFSYKDKRAYTVVMPCVPYVSVPPNNCWTIYWFSNYLIQS